MGEFFEPGAGQCAPAIDGVCIGWAGVDALLQEQSRREQAWKIALIDSDERASIAAAKQHAAERVAEHGEWWARWGMPIGASALVVGLVGGFAAAWSVRR